MDHRFYGGINGHTAVATGPGDSMELVLIVTLAFTTGVLSAWLAALTWTRHYRDKLRRELETQKERMHTLEYMLLYRGGPNGLPMVPPVIPVPPPGRRW
jgi:hypothetical protein